jgi:AcrR family transcriptional regulator
MPKLWTETIASHRDAVRDAALDSAAVLVQQRGLRGVTMSEIARRAGVGRATLYKYFPDVESILAAWHSRQIEQHLRLIAQARDRAPGPRERLAAVLETYALIGQRFRGRHDAELAAFLHRDERAMAAEHRVRRMVAELIRESVADGAVRDDVPPDELAAFCLHALAAARGMRSRKAVSRLVDVTLTGLRPSG